jgi:predicted aspartyl protease
MGDGMCRASARFIVAAIFAVGGFSTAFADGNCQLGRYASLDLGTDETGGVYIPMKIAGHDENMLVDTGGYVSMLTASAVQQLSLRRQATPGGAIMYGGLQLHEFAIADEIGLGHMAGRRIDFLIMPDQRMPTELSGTIAPDIMKNYDVELDFANGKFNLFAPNSCGDRVVYWTHEAFAQLPIQLDNNKHIRIQVRLDGKPLEADLDTGSSRSLLRFERAKDIFGWDEKTADLKRVASTKDGTPISYQYPFKSLNFEGVAVSSPDLLMVSDKASKQYGQPELIIGMGILRQLHLYLAYPDRVLYLTSADAH